MGIKLEPKQEEAVGLILSNKYTLLYGSGRSGKTFATIFLIVYRALKYKSRHLVIRFRFSHVKASIILDTLPKVMSIMGAKYKINKSDWIIFLPNGSEIHFGGIDDKERIDKILGLEFSTIFINEASQISYDAYTTLLTRLAERTPLQNRMILDCNPPTKASWLYKLFILKQSPETKSKLNNPDQYAHLKMVIMDNLANIDDDYYGMMSELTGRKHKRFFLGDFADEDSAALFNETNIAQNRAFVHPELNEIIIAIDPAVTAKINSDKTAIVVTAKGEDGRGYILETRAGQWKPREWGTLAVALYEKYKAKYIVAEKNQGGDMITHTINTISQRVPVKLVHASKGKLLRAEPVSALYENGMISHVGTFPDLEDEMVNFTGAPGEKSPNLLDALVYGVTFLFPNEMDFNLSFDWD
jgi:PBSX family phage terminase large subunit